MFGQSEKKTIFISNFLNPNCFYFKNYDGMLNGQLKVLEDEVAEHAWNRMRNNINSKFNLFEPKLNDIIAVYNISWSKWVRAMVKKISVDSSGEKRKQYDLWSIDHGQFINSFDNNSLVSLPVDLRNRKIISVLQGSIYGYGPASLVGSISIFVNFSLIFNHISF